MIVIEKMGHSDLKHVVNLHRTLVPFEVSEAHAEKVYEQIKNDENYAILIAKEEAEILGTITVICCKALATNFLVMEDFVVKDGLRGKGIGGKLMAAADDFAREQGCTYGILVSSGHRKEAHRFYENHGFVEDVRGFRKEY